MNGTRTGHMSILSDRRAIIPQAFEPLPLTAVKERVRACASAILAIAREEAASADTAQAHPAAAGKAPRHRQSVKPSLQATPG